MHKYEMPFEEGIDDPNYVYRFQSCSALRHMRRSVGQFLAPSRWDPAKSCNHKHYESLQETLIEDQSIYTLSVWRNEAAAWKGWRRSERPTDRMLLRIPRDAFDCCRLKFIDDDKLVGEAFLIFQVAPYQDGQIYGDARIPWSSIQQTDGSWHPVQPDREDFRAVGNPFAYDYDGGEVPSRDLDYDFGLPSDEKILRALLFRLDRLEDNLSKIPRWNIVNYWKSRAVYNDALATWRSLPHSESRIQAALMRIATLLPKDHRWHEFIGISRTLANAKQL